MSSGFESSDDVRSGAPLKEVRYARFEEPLPLKLGGELPEFVVAFETFGTLDAERSNAVLVCHAISGDSHVARHDAADGPGWWEELVGPGKPVDTDHLFVVCTNVIGGCRGSTGPGSIDPRTGQRYGREFPTVTVHDMVDAQQRLMQRLGIHKLRAVIGGSLGGHQALSWATRYPDQVGTAIVIACSPRLSSQALAFEVVGRNAVQSDPAFAGGDYYDRPRQPSTGLAIARMLGHITYLSSEAMARRFDMDRHNPRDIETAFEKRFSVGSYLAHQGDRFTERFDANSYCTISMALSLVDFGATQQDVVESLRPSTCDWLVISFTSDWLFTPGQSRQLVSALTALGRNVSYCDVETDAGHDGFLLSDEIAAYGPLLSAKLGKLPTGEPLVQPVDDPIIDMIPRGSSVLDLGCGDGHLLGRLRQRGHTQLCGVDLGTRQLVSTAQFGVEVIDADLNEGLPDFHDGQFDVAVVSATLRMVPNVRTLLLDALRVCKSAVISFANFGYAPLRQMFVEEGRSPKTSGEYAHEWYETPNRRFPTVRDVQELCEQMGVRIIEERYLASGRPLSSDELRDPNLNAETAVFLLGLR